MEFSAKTQARIIAMYQKGTSTNNIGRLLGFHKSHAVKVLAAHHVPLRYRRLTASETVAIADLYTEDLSGTEIAKQFGTTPYLRID